jgi:hypothetical protein
MSSRWDPRSAACRAQRPPRGGELPVLISDIGDPADRRLSAEIRSATRLWDLNVSPQIPTPRGQQLASTFFVPCRTAVMMKFSPLSGQTQVTTTRWSGTLHLTSGTRFAATTFFETA